MMQQLRKYYFKKEKKHVVNFIFSKMFCSGSIVNISELKSIENCRVFSGIQPTGCIHLGNYLGAVKNWTLIQNSGEETIFSIVDLHAITMPHEHINMRESIRNMAATLIACGIDPSQSILFQQSQVPEHGNLSWILSCFTTMPKLSGLAQFKEKSALFTNKSVPTGIFMYPVLQAADILLYKATHIPVGSDNLQNVNLCSHLCQVFNNSYGQIFPVPKALIIDDSVAKIKSLKMPLNKMSKSEVNPIGRIELLDSPEDIQKKIKKAMTDFISEVYYDPENRPGVSNLMTIHKAISEKSYDEISKECSGIDTGKYKILLADLLIQYLTPIREKTFELLSEKGYIESVLNSGCEKARAIASKTINEVYEKLGFKL